MISYGLSLKPIPRNPGFFRSKTILAIAGKGGGAPSTLASWMIDDIKDLCERRGVVGMTQGFINEGYYPLVICYIAIENGHL